MHFNLSSLFDTIPRKYDAVAGASTPLFSGDANENRIAYVSLTADGVTAGQSRMLTCVSKDRTIGFIRVMEARNRYIATGTDVSILERKHAIGICA